MSFKHMKTFINSTGSTIRQSKINDAKLLMSNQFESDPSYNPNMLLWKHGVNIEKLSPIPIKTFNEKYSSSNGVNLQFNALFDYPIVVGDILYDKRRDIYWICCESFDRNEILCAGKLIRCNYMMKWQDEYKHVLEYPVFEINSTQYNSGESSNKTLTIGSSQHLITIVADKNTTSLNRGKRFFWDKNIVNPTVFKITQNDTTSMNYDKGLLRITVTEDQYNPNTDSIKKWLCDYFETSEITVIYTGSPTIRIGGSKILKVDFKETVKWSIESNTNAMLIPAGNTVKVKCPNDTSIINETIIVKAVVGNITGECELIVTGGI